MRPSAAVKAVTLCVQNKQPIFLHGSPGVGKSDVVRQVAKQLGIDLIDLRLSQLDPVDLRGVPSVGPSEANKNVFVTKWNTPVFLPTEGKGILFMDELNSAAQATQAASYQLVLDRKLGDYVLPEGWSIVAAGNRATDRAIVTTMSTALKNRFTHINYDVNNDDWCQWALTDGDIHPAVLGFIRFRPQLLNEFDTESASKAAKDKVARAKDSNAFATPRSWSFLSNLMKANPSKDIEFDLYAGTVGEGPAGELMSYLRHYRNLPDLDALILNPKTTPVPTEMATLYALSTGLASKVRDSNFGAIMTYMERVKKEFQVLCVRDAVTRDRKLTKSKHYIEWAVKNSEVLI